MVESKQFARTAQAQNEQHFDSRFQEVAVATALETKTTSSSSTLKKWTIRGIVAASLIWTVVNWNGLSKVKGELGSAGIFLGLIAASEIFFIIGAVSVAIGGGREVFRGAGLNPVRWASSLVKVREGYRKIIENAPDNRMVRTGFHLNWMAAVSTGVFAAIGIFIVLPVSAWGLLVLPLADIAASFAWRAPIQRRLNQRDAVVGKKPKVMLRNASFSDVPQLVELDASRYGGITEGTTDNPAEMFRLRIINSRGYFWVAEVDGKIEALLACQRSSLRPDDFVSWDQCTANGTFEGTGDDKSPVLYVAAMTSSKHGSQLGLSDRLLAYGIGRALQTGITKAFFSGRMPAYHKHANTMPPQEYYNKRVIGSKGKSVALDPQIRLYESWGMKRHRLVPDGFKEDWESCGYAVLFTFDVPMSGKWYSMLVGTVLKRVANHPKLLAKVL